MAELGPINAELCRTHWQALYEAWETLPQLKECDAILLLTGQPRDGDDLFNQLGVFHLWSFVLIFPDTLMILFKDKRVLFSGRQRKLKYFADLQEAPGMGSEFTFELFQRESKGIEGLSEHMVTCGLIDSIKKCLAGDDSEQPLRMGTFLQGATLPHGQAAEAIASLLGFPLGGASDLNEFGINKNASDCALLQLRWRSVEDDLGRLSLRLDGSAAESARLASVAAGRMAREVIVHRVVNILDQELKTSHRSICIKAEDALDDENRIAKWKTKFGIDGSALELQYCLVESGGIFTLNPDTVPSESELHLGRGSIVIGLALKYHNNMGNIARTVLMDVGQEEKSLYVAALDLQDFLITQLTPGKLFKDIFHAGWEYATEKHPNLVKFLLPDFGGALGSQLSMTHFKFDNYSDQTLDANMAVTVQVAVQNINTQPPTSIWLADSLLVTAEGATEAPWTACCPKKLDDILYALEGASDKPTDKENRSGANAATARSSRTESPLGPSTRTRARRANAGISQAEQEKLLSKQRELRRKKQAELTERFRDGGVGFAKDKKDVRKISHITAYRDPSEFPKDLRPGKCYIDTIRECLFIPTGHRHVPFHVSTLRNVSHQDEDKTHTLRVGFIVPGAVSGAQKEESPLPDLSNEENPLFVKEIIIKSSDGYLMTMAKNLRELMKRARTKEKYRREDDITQQQALQPNRTGRRLILRNLMVRHSGAHSRKIVGSLEAHVNGFRYSAIRMESIDIIYTNIRHAFFQPVANEMIILLHFHLQSPIMVQKKKVKDIQFYCEVANQADDLDARRNRSNNDPDEIYEEQREHEKKRRLNLEFRRFVEQSQQMAPVVFEIPKRSLQFYGVPRNSSVALMPTQNCLVNLVDWPAFILTMEDVEIVSFERVMHGLKHLDAVFVPKDYGRPVQTVATIPVASLDMLKNWLNDMDIVWYEGKQNLAWPAIFKTIRSDIVGFVKQGGFSDFLDTSPDARKKRKDPGEDVSEEGSDSDNSDDDDAEDEEYQESSESESGSDYDEDESGSEVESGSDEEASGEGSDEDESEEDDEEDLSEEDDEEDRRARKRRDDRGGSSAKRRRQG